MRGIRLKFVIVIISALVLAAIFIGFLLLHKNQADKNIGSTYSGEVFLDSSATASIDDPNAENPTVAAGANVLLTTDSELCQTKTYSATADSQGNFTIILSRPVCTCPYRVIAGGNGDYNAVDNGKVTLAGSDISSLDHVVLRTNKIRQAMHSYYFGQVYKDGYYGYYHLSQWDSHFLRNKIDTDQLLKSSAPSHAEFTLNVDHFGPVIPMDENAGKDYMIDLIISAYATPDGSWTSNLFPQPITTEGALQSKKISLNVTKGVIVGDLHFSFDLTGYTPEQRHGIWMNGFMLSFQFDGELGGNNLTEWQSQNPDILLPLQAPDITYSGFEDYENPESCSFVWPAVSKHVTSPFGMRVHPLTHVYKLHDGIDISADDNDAIVAAASGVVTSAGPGGAYGLRIFVKHCNGYTTVYNHLKRDSIVVKVGQQVRAGQRLAGADSTGSSTGTHLHFMLLKNGKPLNPLKYLPQN